MKPHPELRAALQTAAATGADSPLCRGEQFQELCAEIQCHIAESTVRHRPGHAGHCLRRSAALTLSPHLLQATALYVSGLPGTGKSFTADLAMRECARWAPRNGIARPSMVWINCMSLSQPRHVFQVRRPAAAAAAPFRPARRWAPATKHSDPAFGAPRSACWRASRPGTSGAAWTQWLCQRREGTPLATSSQPCAR